LLLSPIRNWWFLILAAFPAHIAVQMQSDVPLTMQLCWFISNSSEALIGAGLYRHFQKNQVEFDSTYDVTLFLICVSFFGPFLSSFLDAGFVLLNAWGKEDYWHVWRMRFFSNALAEFTLVLAIIVWSKTDIAFWRRLLPKRIFESICLAAGLFIVTIIVFDSKEVDRSASTALLYAPLPFLLWSVARFGFKGLSTSVLTVAFLAIWGAGHGHGPFASSDPIQNAFLIQVFLLVFSVPLMYLTAVLLERKRAREIAVENEERLRLALNAAQMSSWNWDLATNQISWSDESKNIFGTQVQRGDSSFESFLSSLHTDDRSVVLNVFNQAIQERSSYEVEFRIVNPNGKIQWVIGKGKVLFDESGQPIRVRGVNVDITERKEAEFAYLEQRRELYLLSRVAVLGNFTGNLAHELNQPLASIKTNTEAALLFLSQDADDEVREALNDIIEQNNRAFDVITGLRELLKKGGVDRSPINLNEVIQRVLTITRSELISRNITVITQLSSNLPKVEGDRVQLEQVLMNLILNAVEAMSSAEVVKRKLVVATTSLREDIVDISVEDCGKGITLENADQIFEPFYTTKENGLGLGLSISRSIAMAHNGKLWVTNNPEVGATFHLSLPCL
jgi:PAS domain S-box-containing protein